MDSEPCQADRPIRSRRPRVVWVLASIGGFLSSLFLLILWSEGYGLVFQSVIVREPLLDDQRPEPHRYFGFSDDEDGLKPRNIAEVTGPFSLGTWFSAWLNVVRSGKVEEINAFTVGRSSNRIGAPTWRALGIRLALGEARTPDGWIVNLGSYGHERGGGRGSDKRIEHFTATAFRLFPGKLSNGKKCLIYVEGDHPFDADRSMTVEEFAEKNRGNYLVVVGQLD
jgi:hypothetical protein